MYISTTTSVTFVWIMFLRYTTSGQKIDVTIPIMMPYLYKHKNTVNRAVSAVQNSIYVRRMGILTKYKPKLKPVIFYRDSPDEILQIFNKTIMEEQVNTAIYIQYKEDDKAMASADYTISLLEELGVPVLSWDPNYPGSLEKMQDRMILQLAPTVYHNAQGMLQLMEFFNWTHFTIVTSTRTNYFDFIESVKELVESKNKVKTVPQKLEFKLLETILCDIGEGDDIAIYTDLMESCLKRKVPKENRIFLLHTEERYATTFLETASKLNLITKEHMWILSSTSVGLAQDKDVNYPIGVLGLTTKYGGREGKAISTAITDSVRVWLRMMSKLARNSSLQLFPDFKTSSDWPDGKYIYKEMLHTDIIKDTRDGVKSLIEFTDYGLNKYPQLQIVNTQRSKRVTSSSRRAPARKVTVVEKTSWKQVGDYVQKLVGSGNNVQVIPKIELSSITWPGNQPFPPLGRPPRRFFSIATLAEEPYVMYRGRDATTGNCIFPATECRVVYNATKHGNDSTYENGTVINCCTGLSIDLLRIISDRMKFDFNLFEVPDQTFGIQDENGDWNGLIKLIQDNGADMAITALQITPRRNRAIQFSMPYLETGTTIIVSLTKGAISATAVLEPYDYPAWCLILVFSVHSIGASIFIFEWLSPAGLDQGKTPLREHKFSLFRSFWLIWAMLFGAAVSADNPRGVSSRFLGNVWALFALVFLASYTANLAAFMITKETYYDLSGIQDWRLTSPYKHKPRPFKFATVPNGSTEENLRETRPEMYKYMSQYNQNGVREAIAALKSQEINAFIYDATPLEYQVGIDPDCDLRTVGQSYAMTGYGVGFPQEIDSELITEVNKIILDLQEDGEIGRLRKFWLAGACHSKLSRKQTSDHLGILNFTSAFILLAAGIVLGGLLLFLEHLYFRFGRKCLKQYDKCGCCALVSLSMGKSLTFEQTIMEAIDLHKKHRCKDPLCETQLWKAKHELDLALLKIQKLNREIVSIKEKRPFAIKNTPENPPQPDAKFTDDTNASKSPDTANGKMRQRRQDPTLRRSPSYTIAIESDKGAVNKPSSLANETEVTNVESDPLLSDNDKSLKNNKQYVFNDGEV